MIFFVEIYVDDSFIFSGSTLTALSLSLSLSLSPSSSSSSSSSWKFFSLALADGFPLEFKRQQSPQVSRTLYRTLYLIIIRSGCLAEIWWSVCVSKPKRNSCVSFSRTDYGLCLHHLFVWSNFNFLHNSQWITLPTYSCLVCWSFCANSQHPLIM